ncbi:hypothetical protein F5Y15DRAFT_421293 [Xylariaceae sp. FL0016]|nr:hypothetical protein F5Y15DRAFT_421293 [Xylariaceae sp. FL0016]
MASTADPYYQFKEDDHSALVVIVTVILFLLAASCVAIRIFIRLSASSLQKHDWILLGGVVFMILQTGCILWQCREGLGKHRVVLSDDSLDLIRKLRYASSFFALIICACTKASVCVLIYSINNNGTFFLATRITLGVAVVACVAGCLALTFRCPLPTPWLALSDEQCPGARPINLYNAVVNMVTDLMLCVLPIGMVWKVQTTVKRKIQVIMMFVVRIVVPIAIILSVLDTRYLLSGPEYDFTWLSVMPYIWIQVYLGLSVITACVPNMKSFFDVYLGHTMGMTVEVPYQLTRLGKGHLQASANTTEGGSRSRGKSTRRTLVPSHSDLALVKPSKTGTNLVACYNSRGTTEAGRSSEDASGINPGSESSRNLTDGVILVRDEVKVSHDGRQRHPSIASSSSRGSFGAVYNQPIQNGV